MSLPSHQRVVLLVTVIGLAAMASANNVLSQLGTFTARDPAVPTGGAGAGDMLPNLSSLEQQVFGLGKEAFEEDKSSLAGLRDKDANLYSDLLLHAMGPGLADDVAEGNARGGEFRAAPLWGLGKRAFFLRDGRMKDLLEAIKAPASAASGIYQASEANQVTARFNGLTDIAK